MKKILLLLVIFTALVTNAQTIIFPDPAFKAKLLMLGTAIGFNNQFITLDANSDGEIQVSEAVLAKYLRVNGGNISSLEGIQNFSAMQELQCDSNVLTSLNLDGMVNLTSVRCESNQLTTLSLNGLINLLAIDCSDNSLTQLDLTGLDSLGFLNCDSNQLTSLDFSANPAFEELSCSFNNLQFINLKNGVISTNVDMNWGQNPNLAFICADEDEIIYAQLIVESSGMQPVSINNYCSFTPGGDYNTITGTVRNDSNNNGCDIGDTHFPRYVRLDINDGTNQGATFIETNGSYSFHTGVGNYTITPNLEYPNYFNYSPSPGVANFPALDNSVQQLDFCITPNGTHPDLEVVLSGRLPKPGFTTFYQLVYRNNGNTGISGSVNLNFDGTRMNLTVSDPAVDAQTSNTLTWNFSNLYPFETRSIIFFLNVNGPTATPPVNAGDAFTLTASSAIIAGEETPANNIFTLNQIAANSYDPNIKTCLEGETIAPSHIGNFLHYNIDFENIGDEAAQNIVVKDTIDITKFDINTLRVIQASHNVRAKISGNVVEFIFENINLPSAISNPIGGHGNVLFKIKTLPTLQVGDMVTNTANIYFDYNHPIETNEARTTFATLKRQEFITDNSVVIFPNPARQFVSVSAKNNIKSVAIFDIQGRILQTIIADKNAISIDISDKSQGIYFLKVTTTDGIKVEKIIK